MVSVCCHSVASPLLVWAHWFIPPQSAAAATADPDFSEFTYLDRSKLAVAGDAGSGDDGDASPECSDEESDKE
jgi:hypothetical protein